MQIGTVLAAGKSYLALFGIFAWMPVFWPCRVDCCRSLRIRPYALSYLLEGQPGSPTISQLPYNSSWFYHFLIRQIISGPIRDPGRTRSHSIWHFLESLCLFFDDQCLWLAFPLSSYCHSHFYLYFFQWNCTHFWRMAQKASRWCRLPFFEGQT